ERGPIGGSAVLFSGEAGERAGVGGGAGIGGVAGGFRGTVGAFEFRSSRWIHDRIYRFNRPAWQAVFSGRLENELAGGDGGGLPGRGVGGGDETEFVSVAVSLVRGRAAPAFGGDVAGLRFWESFRGRVLCVFAGNRRA